MNTPDAWTAAFDLIKGVVIAIGTSATVVAVGWAIAMAVEKAIYRFGSDNYRRNYDDFK